MFYSHEVLTNRKYGVATVWLVATLGAKSIHKKVNRKAIREVDVPKACRTIVDPGAPMALRLQGNLLYGVSRVHLEQCGYVLADAENASTAMRMMLKLVKNAATDPQAGRARPELLVLQDDPSFLPEFALPPLELIQDLNLPMSRPSGDSQSLTPFGSQQAPPATGDALGGIIVPSSSPGPGGDFMIQGLGGFDDPSGMSGTQDEPLQLEEDFGFNSDGEMIEFAAGEKMPATPANPTGATMPSDGGASSRVRKEFEEGQAAGIEQLDDQLDIDLPMLGEDLPEGDAFDLPQDQDQQDEGIGSQSSNHAEEADSSSTVASAPMRQQRKPRQAKIIEADRSMELHNKDLADWNNNYLQNMADAKRIKNKARSALQAKKNAEFWVWGAGIGGIGQRIPGASGPTPFDMFLGDNLFQLLTGVDRRTGKKAKAGSKRDRDSGIDEATEGESRNVRPRLEDAADQEVGRAQDDEDMLNVQDDGGMFNVQDEEIELPRDAPAALDDQQLFSAMPWNSASIRGSSAIPQSTSLQQRGSRMVSASPLKGRGSIIPGDNNDALARLSGEDYDFSVEGEGLPPQPSSDGGYLGSPYDEDQPNVRVREPLSAESGNFLAFIADAISTKRQREQELEEDADVDEVLFEDLLPPPQTTKMVAVQGLMMVLALGTTGLLHVRQDGNFEEIGVRLTDKAKAMTGQEDLEEGDGEGDPEDGDRDDDEREMSEAEDMAEAAEESDDHGDDDGDGDGNGDNDSLYDM